MKLLKKLSASGILGPVIEVVKTMAVGTQKPAYSVVGICDAYETGTSQFGEWIRFVGNFEAINYLDGEVVRAPKAHIPDVLEAILMDGIKDNAEIVASKATKTTQYYQLDNPIEFAYEVDIERMPDTDEKINNYKYITKPKIDVGATDSLAHLSAKVAPAQLAAPEPEPKQTPAKKTTAKK